MVQLAQNNHKILIVEDDLLTAAAAGQELAHGGYALCELAHSGADALAIARREAPDIAVVDVRLGGTEDGLAVGEILALRHGIAVLYATGSWMRLVMGPAHGIACLSKPFTMAHLATAVDAVRQRAEGGGRRGRGLPPGFAWLPDALDGAADQARRSAGDGSDAGRASPTRLRPPSLAS